MATQQTFTFDNYVSIRLLNNPPPPRAVVGYGVKIFLPSPPNYVTRSPGYAREFNLQLCELCKKESLPIKFSHTDWRAICKRTTVRPVALHAELLIALRVALAESCRNRNHAKRIRTLNKDGNEDLICKRNFSEIISCLLQVVWLTAFQLTVLEFNW